MRWNGHRSSWNSKSVDYLALFTHFYDHLKVVYQLFCGFSEALLKNASLQSNWTHVSTLCRDFNPRFEQCRLLLRRSYPLLRHLYPVTYIKKGLLFFSVLRARFLQRGVAEFCSLWKDILVMMLRRNTFVFNTSTSNSTLVGNNWKITATGIP